MFISQWCLFGILICIIPFINAFRSPLSIRESKMVGISTTTGVVQQHKTNNMQLFAIPPRREDKGPPKKKVPKDDVIQVNGRVIESLPNAMFRVEIEPSKNIVLVTISGKIRKNFVRIVVGDSVVCELSAYDLTRGRITYRNK